MGLTQFSNSNRCAATLPVFSASEVPVDSEFTGVYVGRTATYSLPFMLCGDSLVNPHIAIIGMTGSGKTFMLKSVIVRTAMYSGRTVFVLDWNGEYADLIGAFGGESVRVDSDMSLKKAANMLKRMLQGAAARPVPAFRIASVDLSAASSVEDRQAYARQLLESMALLMVHKKISEKVQSLVVLDEAWKLVGAASLASMFREGRKYGIGIIVSTQLGRDITNEIISNSATIVMFKLQNSEDFRMLLDSAVISDADVGVISALPVGSCMVMQRYRHSGTLFKSVVSHIEGLVGRGCTLKFGDKMKSYVAQSTFERLTKAAFRQEHYNEISRFVWQGAHNIDLVLFIRLLMRLGLHRPAIVTYLRSLGIDDIAIISAYAESELESGSRPSGE